ncbi:Rna/Rnp Complex-1-Interacting Phosphatase, partial [Manis pentadactyla]
MNKFPPVPEDGLLLFSRCRGRALFKQVSKPLREQKAHLGAPHWRQLPRRVWGSPPKTC